MIEWMIGVPLIIAGVLCLLAALFLKTLKDWDNA